jgi:type I restriction-modification system DNA methylase subunit
MTFNQDNSYAFMVGTEDDRVEALKELLGYPVLQHDPQGSAFWYLRPGKNENEALETCPIAIGFYSELNEATDQEIKKILTSKEKQHEIYGHYANREFEQQPVMYLLLPTTEGTGRVPLVLPTEGGLRQRQIETFQWNDAELIARLNRLKQGELPIATKSFCSIPQVDWVFYPAAKTAGELARALAEAARRIEQAIPKVYQNEGTDGYLHKLLKSFQRELLPALQLTSDNEKDYSFADIYAQTIAYALFTARVFGYVKDKREGREKETHFDRESAWQQLPETNPFLRKLFEDISQQTPKELGDELIGAIADIFGILRAAKMDAILSDFQLKMNREDIVIRFYEDFLAAYKPQMRERRGVYYTPEPVVSYMVRSVDILVKEKFNKPLGLADPEVMILDPACGTGTFLLCICQLIYQRFQNSPDALTEGLADKSWSGYVKERLLPRIFGFELLMAPYAIAHLKLGLFLQETGYQFDSGKRLGVYLTNTLDNDVRKSETFFDEFIAQEADTATEIKRDKPIMVVVGNPPYSVTSENTGDWINGLIEDYKKGLDERKINLDDDFIKFIRFAQWRISQTSFGILAFISNHVFLDGVTHRRMRQSLLETFDEINVVDLHGNIKNKERTPNGLNDENVFDIQQGVAISFMIKNYQEQKSIVNHCNLWGMKEKKYDFLLKNDIQTTTWSELSNVAEASCLGQFFFFSPKAFDNIDEYCCGFSVADIFSSYVNGIETHRDEISIHIDKNQLTNVIENLQRLNVDDFREKFNLKPDGQEWSIKGAKESVKSLDLADFQPTEILYRPFDFRYTFINKYSRGFLARPRYDVMKHMIHPNLGIVLTRLIARDDPFDAVLITQFITEKKTGDSTRSSYLFPMYLYTDATDGQVLALEQPCRPNFSQKFLNTITTKLGYTPTPEAIIYYIYAIFHSPTYRTRYAEFLKIAFPRVPLTSNNELFQQLANYGEELVSLHLMKSLQLDNFITKFVEKDGNNLVDAGHPKYNQDAVIINKKGDKFTGVPEEVWKFQIGGYQVCQKWLKDRKGRQLTDDDIQHYQRIVVALQQTIKLMNKIDQAIPGFPIQ